MATPLPSDATVDLRPPGPDEVRLIARGLRSASQPTDQSDALQLVVLRAVTRSMTGIDIDYATLEPIGAADLAAGLAARNVMFRTRLVQLMELGHMVLARPDVAVADRVISFAHELGIDNECIHAARRVADGSHQLVATDFDRNGYITGLDSSVIGTGIHGVAADPAEAWSTSIVDEALAARWQALGDLPPASIGRQVHEMYLARGFAFPGQPGSAPPLLAQHDWVHVLADFATTVESELEVFGFIARASDDPHAFALLAMALNLFQTGLLPSAAGIFEADAGHLTGTGMPERLADAMRRGALCTGSIDFLAVDWFALAEHTVPDLRDHFGVPGKADEAIRAGSVGPWDPSGLSSHQLAAGQRLAADEGRPYRPPAPVT